MDVEEEIKRTKSKRRKNNEEQKQQKEQEVQLQDDLVEQEGQEVDQEQVE